MNSNAIRNTLTAALLAAALAGCVTPGMHHASARYSINCTNGGTFVNVSYGDSEIKVHPIANVARGGALEFRLKPNRRRSDTTDYEDMEVTIEGKTPDASWLNEAGSYNDKDSKLVVCVPEDIDMKTYYYFITVEDVGTLDPRADVTM